MDWKKYINKDLTPMGKLRSRDRVVTNCPQCGSTGVVLISNLKAQIKRLGIHLCWSCSARKGALEARERYVQTMLDRYGVDNPQKVESIKNKTLETKKKKGPPER